MKRLRRPSIISVVLLILFNKIDGNHKDTVICQKYWEMLKKKSLSKTIFHFSNLWSQFAIAIWKTWEIFKMSKSVV